AAYAGAGLPLLDHNALTLGFARRFTGYKRPNLLLHDRKRLTKILLTLTVRSNCSSLAKRIPSTAKVHRWYASGSSIYGVRRCATAPYSSRTTIWRWPLNWFRASIYGSTRLAVLGKHAEPME